MEYSRRTVLKAGSASALGGGVLASATQGVLADTPPAVADGVADEWMPAHETNYYQDRRPSDDVNWIVIHRSAGSFYSGTTWFQHPDGASAHYFIKADTHYDSAREPELGHTVQMVRDTYSAWHAGSEPYNRASIGIEHSGKVKPDSTIPTVAYRKSAKLAAYLAHRHDIPVHNPEGVAPADPASGGGIIGHDQVPDPDNPRQGGGKGYHTDPEAWNWDFFMDLVRKYFAELTFEAGDSVVTTAEATVRSSAEVAHNVQAMAPKGTTGTVENGPHRADRFTWWWVSYETGASGWTLAEKLRAAEDGGGPTGRFESNQRVALTARQPIRGSARANADPVRTLAASATGYVREGPTRNDGTKWYQVRFNVGVTGWVPGSHLTDAARFDHNERVATQERATIYSDPDGSPIDTLGTDAVGYVRDGPRQASSTTWYKVGFNAGVEGWTATQNLRFAHRFNRETRVRTTSATTAMSSPGSDGGGQTLQQGAVGYVHDGPKSADERTWYEIRFNAGVRGWVRTGDLEATRTGNDDDKFVAGARVEVTGSVTAYDDYEAQTGATVLSDGQRGIVQDGPYTSDGAVFWAVHFYDGTSGFVEQDSLS